MGPASNFRAAKLSIIGTQQLGIRFKNAEKHQYDEFESYGGDEF